MMGLVRAGIVTLAALALTAGPAPAQPKAPGVTDTESAIGLTAPMAGPDILLRYEPKLQGGEETARAGATDMIIAVEGLKKADRNFTRDDFIEAMEGIRNFTVPGLSSPITFGPDRHHGLNSVRLMRAQKAADLSYVQVAPYQVFKPLF